MSIHRDNSETSVGTQKLSVRATEPSKRLYVADGDGQLLVGVDESPEISLVLSVDSDVEVDKLDEIRDDIDVALKEARHVLALDPTTGNEEDLIDTDCHDVEYGVVE